MRTATLRELNSNSSALARAAEAGETIVITDRGRPIADIVPHRPDVPPGVTRAEMTEMFEKLQAAGAGFDYDAFRAQMDEAVDPYAYDAFERFG
jgi:prevent-host-death family protein